MAVVPRNRIILFFALAIIGASVDLGTKSRVFGTLGMPLEQPGMWLWPGHVAFETSLNEGALFGLGQGWVPLFAGLSIVAFLGIVYWLFVAGAAQDLLLTTALGMITGGVIGNLYDRLGLHGLVWTERLRPDAVGERVYAVRDWILIQASDQWQWPNFNIADSLLVCGAGLLIWHAVRVPSASARDSEGDSAERDKHSSTAA